MCGARAEPGGARCARPPSPAVPRSQAAGLGPQVGADLLGRGPPSARHAGIRAPGPFLRPSLPTGGQARGRHLGCEARTQGPFLWHGKRVGVGSTPGPWPQPGRGGYACGPPRPGADVRCFSLGSRGGDMGRVSLPALGLLRRRAPGCWWGGGGGWPLHPAAHRTPLMSSEVVGATGGQRGAGPGQCGSDDPHPTRVLGDSGEQARPVCPPTPPHTRPGGGGCMQRLVGVESEGGEVGEVRVHWPGTGPEPWLRGPS